MTVEFALFLSPEGIALAHRQASDHWALIGDTALDVPDLGGALAGLRAMGEERGGRNFPTLLILPDDQILYTELEGLGGSAAIPGRLEGLTPYAVEDLAYDWRDLGGGRAALAVVARDTLDEAEGFARDNGFNGVGFAASPPVEKYPGVPLFQLADEARGLNLPDSGLAFGPDTWTRPDPEEPPEPAAEIPVTPAPEPEPGPAIQAEPPDRTAETAAPEGPEETGGDLAPVVKSRQPRNGRPAGKPSPQDTRDETPDDGADDDRSGRASDDEKPVLQMPTGFGARRGKVSAPGDQPGSLISTRSSRFGLAPQPAEPDPAETGPETAPAISDAGARAPSPKTAPPRDSGLAAPTDPPADSSTGVSAPTRSPAAHASSVPGRRLTPDSDLRLGDRPTGGVPVPPGRSTGRSMARPTNAPSAESGAAIGRVTARILRRKDLTATSGDAAPPAGADIAEPDAPITGGLLARRAASGAGPSLKTGLLLTLILLLILALVAVWSALFLPDSSVARWLGRETPDVEIATAPAPARPAPSATVSAPAAPDRAEELARLEPPATAAPEPETASEPSPAAAPPDTAGLDMTLPDIDADLDLGPAPTDPETLLPSPEETEALYAASGIWQRPPEQPSLVDPSLQDEIYMASIDPVVVTHDAFAIPAPDLEDWIGVTRRYASPPPFGTTFTLGPDGLVVPARDGALTADGIRIFAGTPPILPVPRDGRAAPEPDAEATDGGPDGDAVETAILASFQPTPRPDDLAERRERLRLGGFTANELANRRPTARPPSVQQVAMAVRAATAATTPDPQTGTPGSTFDAEALTAERTPEIRVIEASALAVASSRMPRLRPSDFNEIVARATQGSTGQGSSGAATVVQTASAPAPVQPAIPSSATVTRAATTSNAINLRNVNLIGVSGTPSNRRALVRLPSGRFVRVSVGDRVDGGRVAAIGEDTLQYVKNGRNITLEIPG
ncbi:hypothetical protein [Rhodophyticola porphyridii]|uniref:hypothetical protein n=1 Tax=Rhodophyticola porphyridii TaxID=1852017 RepID=UPI0035CF1A2B